MISFKRMAKAIGMELREHKSSFIVYTVLRVLVIAIVIYQFINKNYESAFLGLLTLTLLIVPSFVQVTLKIELPTMLEIIILLFVFCAEILGEIANFYVIYRYWDTILHTLNGFLAAAIGFSLVNLLNKSEKFIFELSPLFTTIVAFCFSMTIGVLWEMFEYGMDTLFLFDMQKDTIVNRISSVKINKSGENIPITLKDINKTEIYSDNGKTITIIDNGYLDIGLIDTMKDLFVNFIGAVVFCILGYLYIKNRDGYKFLEGFISKKKSKVE